MTPTKSLKKKEGKKSRTKLSNIKHLFLLSQLFQPLNAVIHQTTTTEFKINKKKLYLFKEFPK